MTPERPGDEVRPDLDETIVLGGSESMGIPGQPVPAEFESLELPGYEIVSLLGRGGMGVVFLARQMELDRCVAVKMLSPSLGRSEEGLRRLHIEAKALASLNHPNIVVCHDVVRDVDRVLVVMDYVPGRLSVLALSEHYGPIPEQHAASIIVQTARGLDYCHGKGIIHRDIKPSNLLVFHDRDGLPDSAAELLAHEHTRIMIADFGIAKTARHADAHSTADGQVMGTPAFMSPEQAEGKPVDHRTDVYALGATFFRLLTGRDPFEADTPQEALRLRLTTDLPDIRRLDTKITGRCGNVLSRMTARDPVDRYQNYQELIGDLDELAAATKPRRSRRLALGRPKPWTWLVAATLAGLVLAAWFAFSAGQAGDNLSDSLQHWSGAVNAWSVAPPDDASVDVVALICQTSGEPLTLNRPIAAGSDVSFHMRLPGAGQFVASIASDSQPVWELQWSRGNAGEQLLTGLAGHATPVALKESTQPSDWYAVRLRTSPSQLLLYLNEVLVDYHQTDAVASRLELSFELKEGHLAQLKDVRIVSPEDREETSHSDGSP